MRIFLDMDDVLVDFTGGACRIHGFSREQFRRVMTPGVWSMIEPMGLTPAQFWEPIHAAGAGFWIDLLPCAWVQGLLNTVGRTDLEDWHVISTPSRCPTSYDGKVRWLKKQFGDDFDRFAITPHKYLMAKPDTILIDDRLENCEAFIDAGGNAILFPSMGNSLHKYSSDPLPIVREQLKIVIGQISRVESSRGFYDL